MATGTLTMSVDVESVPDYVEKLRPLLETVPVNARELVLDCLVGQLRGLCSYHFVPASDAGGDVGRLHIVLPAADELFAAALRAAEGQGLPAPHREAPRSGGGGLT
jgi:hypothetical protein